MPRPRQNGNVNIMVWLVGAVIDRPLNFAAAAHFPRQGGVTPPVSHYIKCVRKADTPNLLFIIYYLLFLYLPYARQPLHSPKQSPPPAENRQTGANQTYFTSSFGSKMFSKIATIAAGTMPEPPNTSRTASGVCARMPVLAPIP